MLLGACSKPAGTTTSSTTSTPGKNNLDAAPPKNSALNVSVVTPKTGQLSVARSVSATLTAARDSNVAALTGGAVVGLPVKEGQSVTSGQVVVELDASTLTQALDNAKLQLQNAQINLSQSQRNTGQNTAQLQAALSAAQTNYDKATQDLESQPQSVRAGRHQSG